MAKLIIITLLLAGWALGQALVPISSATSGVFYSDCRQTFIRATADNKIDVRLGAFSEDDLVMIHWTNPNITVDYAPMIYTWWVHGDYHSPFTVTVSIPGHEEMTREYRFIGPDDFGPQADLDGSGRVDLADLAIFCNYWMEDIL